jgi:AmmeMemoRadiSam system protein A
MDIYTSLAKQAIEQFILSDTTLAVPNNLPHNMIEQQAGIFVNIYNVDRLRGCFGTYFPTQDSIAKEVIANAIAACGHDFRFEPITEDELLSLRYEVEVLSNPVIIKDEKSLSPKKDGILVKCSDGRCGILLPNISSVETVEQQLYIACQKGGIDPHLDKYQIYTFTVEKHY